MPQYPSVSRPAPLLLIAVALAGYGVYRALYLPAMLVAPPATLLFLGFLLQALFAMAGAAGVWWGARWAPLAIVLLGASIAGTALIEGFVLGIVAYLRALVEGLVGIVVTLVIAAYVRGGTSGFPTDGTRR